MDEDELIKHYYDLTSEKHEKNNSSENLNFLK